MENEAGRDIDVHYDEETHEDEQEVDTRVVMTAFQAAHLRIVLDTLDIDTLRRNNHLGADVVETLRTALATAADLR
jgi:hypothetical protein